MAGAEGFEFELNGKLRETSYFKPPVPQGIHTILNNWNQLKTIRIVVRIVVKQVFGSDGLARIFTPFHRPSTGAMLLFPPRPL